MSAGKIRSGTLHLSDEEFMCVFESCELAGASFHHADHVRLTWIYVRQFGEQVATERMLAGILRFATQSGSPKKFHYTQTCAWVRLIAAAHRESPELMTFAEFVAVHPELLETNALARYYSKSVLESPGARVGWVEPDISPLPSLGKQSTASNKRSDQMGILAAAKPAIVICTRDRARATAFYRDVLGFELAYEDNFASVFNTGGVTLRVSVVADFIPHEHTILGFSVPDVEATVRALREKGVTFNIYPHFKQDELGVLTVPGGAVRVAWFKDLDGNVLSVTNA